MKKIRVRISFEDDTFARRFAESICDEFDVVIGKNSESSEPDITISDKDDEECDMKLFWSREDEDERSLYAFEGIAAIKKKISLRYSEVSGDDEYGICKSETRIIAVCSACGGCGTTTAAMTVSDVLSGNNLFLSLDYIPPRLRNHDDAPLDINRFLYMIFDREHRISKNAVTYEDDKNVQHIRYGEKYNILRMMDAETFIKLLHYFSEYDFDNIIIDMGCMKDEKIESVLNVSDNVIYIRRGESNKEREYLEYIKGIFSDEIITIDNMADASDDELFMDNNEAVPLFSDILKSIIQKNKSIC